MNNAGEKPMRGIARSGEPERSWRPALKPFAGALAILIPMLLGLVVRLNGIRHGEPDMIYHPDVAKQALVARWIHHGNLNLRRLFKDNYELTLYPQGMAVLTGTATRLHAALCGGSGRMTEAGNWHWALAMRHVGIALFLLPVGVCIAVVSRQWGSKAAFWMGILLVIEPIHAQFNHYAMNDSPLAGLFLLAWAASTMMREERRWPLYSLLSGVAVGVGFGVKYTGIVGLVFPGVAWLVLIRQRSWQSSLRSAFAVATGCTAGILATCPLLLQDPVYFMRTLPVFMRWQSNIMGTPILLWDKLRTNLHAVAVLLLSRGHIVLVLGAAGAALLAWRRRDARMAAPLASALLFCTVFFVAVVGSRDMFRANDLIPAYILLVVAWGSSLAPTQAAITADRRLAMLVPLLGFGLAPVFLWHAVQDGNALARTDTRLLARDWCRENLPTGATVLSERYTLPVDRADIRERRQRFLSEAAREMHPGHLINSESAAPMLAARFKEFDYYVVSSLASDRFFDRGSPYYCADARRAYDWIRSFCRPVAEFRDRELWFAHPVVTVYRNGRLCSTDR